jgi:Transposase zinc-ribbon domain
VIAGREFCVGGCGDGSECRAVPKGSQRACVRTAVRHQEQSRTIVVASRWPRGFECPGCGGRRYSLVTTRDLYQCTRCRRQTSPIAGTVFASTHLPLRLWFRAIYHLTQTKQGISSIELGRHLGVTQTTAWKIKHKLKQVMLERDATKRLTLAKPSMALSRPKATSAIDPAKIPAIAPTVPSIPSQTRVSAAKSLARRARRSHGGVPGNTAAWMAMAR